MHLRIWYDELPGRGVVIHLASSFFFLCGQVLPWFVSFCFHSNVVRLPGSPAASASSHFISSHLSSEHSKRDASSLMPLHTTRAQTSATGLWKSRVSSLRPFVSDHACLTSGHYTVLITVRRGRLPVWQACLQRVGGCVVVGTKVLSLTCVCIWSGQVAELPDAGAEWRMSCAFRTGKYGKIMWMESSVKS